MYRADAVSHGRLVKMSRQYREYYIQGRHNSLRFFFSRGEMKRQFDQQAETARHKPQKSEEETHEDRQVFIGLVNGVLIGGLLSGVGGYLAKWSVITICFAVLGGVVIGGLIGAMIARLINFINNRTKKPEKKIIKARMSKAKYLVINNRDLHPVVNEEDPALTGGVSFKYWFYKIIFSKKHGKYHRYLWE
jgi:hypothetical protein